MEGIIRMEWPVYSPDMNPIEYDLDSLERGVSGHLPFLHTLQELENGDSSSAGVGWIGWL